jgi:hypothetical protein
MHTTYAKNITSADTRLDAQTLGHEYLGTRAILKYVYGMIAIINILLKAFALSTIELSKLGLIKTEHLKTDQGLVGKKILVMFCFIYLTIQTVLYQVLLWNTE